MARDTNIALQAPLEEPQVIHRDHLVRVTNTHQEPLKGRWNGRDFIFRTGVPVDMPVAAALHIFGFGTDDVSEKTRAFNNTGILHKCGSYDRAMEFLQGIKFDEVPPLVEMTDSDPRRRLPRSRRSKTTDAHPSVNGGGEAGEPGDTGSPTDPESGEDLG